MNCRDEKQIARLEEKIAKLEAENERYHEIFSGMSSKLRKAAEENERLRKGICKALHNLDHVCTVGEWCQLCDVIRILLPLEK